MSKFKHLFFIWSLFLTSQVFAQIPVSVPFNEGFIGRQKNSLNSVDDYQIFSNSDLNIRKAYFVQYVNSGNIFVAQGNDIVGFCRLEFLNGNVLEIPGIINWQEKGNGNVTLLLGFIPTNSTRINLKNYNGSANNYYIDGGTATSNLNNNVYTANFGLKYNNQNLTLTDLADIQGSADQPDINTLNDYLAAVRQLDPSGPVTVNSLTTTDQTPTLTGNVTLSSGESLSVIVNGVSYNVAGGNLTITNNTWQLNIPSNINFGTYEVTAIITNSGGYTTTDITTNELLIVSPTITTTGTLKTFPSCSGCTVTPQSFTLSGSNLTSDIVVTAPTGIEVSTNQNSGYQSSVTINQISNTVSTTTVYVKLTNNATAVSSGVLSITSTGATTKTISVTTNTDNALNFDGTSDYVQVPDNNLFDFGTGSFTVEMWVRPTTTTGRMDLISKKNNSSPYEELGLFINNNNDGKLTLWTSQNSGGASNESFLISNSPLVVNKWNHIAVVRNGTTHQIYLNGVLDASATLSARNIASAGDLFIGKNNTSFYFSGSLDEIRFWNVARSSTQIQQNINSDLNGTETNLVAYYDFNNGVPNNTNTGLTTVNNQTSNNTINATLYSFALNGTSSNYVPGFIPNITSSGNVTTVPSGNTLQLTNGLIGGVWSTTNSSVATVDANTGIVTGVSAGAVSITYSICNKTVSYGLTIVTPTVSISGTLKTFTTCSGCTISAQNFAISGSNLGSDVTVTAPTGFVVSSTLTGTYSTTLSFTPTSGTLTTKSVYAKLSNSATSTNGGNFTVTSTGAASKTITATVNTDNALNFDGVGDIVSTASNLNSLNITGDITVETWIRLNQMPGDYVRLIGKGSPSERTYGLWLYSDGSILWQQFNTNTSINNLTTNSSIIPVGKWTHIAASKIGSTVKIYINGNEVATTSAHSGTPNSSTAPLEIGGSSSIHALLNGSMDEVRIWNVGRTSSQILGSYLSELVGDGNANETGLVAYYNFNQGIAGGNNGTITAIEDRTTNGISATLSNFTKTGSTSNFVSGVIPEITAAGNATTVLAGGTLSLTNALVGGVWSSSNSNTATINTSTGLVTGVASGSVTLTYSICDKVVSYSLTVIQPTLTTSGALKTFTSCSGCSINPQSFSISGSNLGANVSVTAPTGFVISTTATGTYVTSLTYTPTSGTLNTTNVFAKLSNSATTASSGNFTVESTGAISKTVTATVNTDNALDFDGQNDYINIGQPLAAGSSYTIEAWVKYDGSTSAMNIVSSNKNVFYISNNKLTAGVNGPSGSGGGSWAHVQNTNNLPANKWTHVAVAFDDPTKSIKLYQNGVLVATGSTSSSTYTLDVNEPLYIGSHSNNSSLNYSPVSFFKGNMDEVRIWNTVLDASTIQNNMYKELAGNESGLKAYYNFNQGTIGGSNTTISILNGLTSPAYNGTMSGFALTTGSTSNFVAGFIPNITAAGNATTVPQGSTLQLTNELAGGTWSTSASGIATINSSGLVTGVASGSVTMTYSICSKTVSYNLTVVVPTLTTNSLKTFTSCSGCATEPQKITVSGSDLGANVTITPPTGFVMSTTSTGTYVTSLTFTPTSGTLNSTDVYVKLQNTSTTGTSGSFTVASTGANSKTVTATVNTDNALNFDGINDHVIIDNIGNNSNLSFAGTSSFTIEAWVNRSAETGANAFIVTKQNSGVDGNYNLFIDANGKPGFYRETSTYQAPIKTSSAIPLNEWHHIAGVYNGSTMKIYLDGVESGSIANTYNVTNPISSLKVAIGAVHSNGTPTGYFKGKIDEVRIWNTARTASQIQNNYLSELAGNETNLKAYYNFNHGIVNGNNSSIPLITSLIDRTSNAINGTINNFALSGSTSNYVAGFIPEISGESILNKGLTTTYTNSLTGGTWSSSNTNIATVNSSTGVVTGIAAGSSTITYTICEKTVTKVVTVVVPTITKTGTLTTFNTCLGTASASQTFTVSAQYLTANLILTAPTGYEISTDGSTYSSTLSISPTSGTVSARLIYVRLSSASVNGQSGNISISSTDAITQNISTGNALVTRTVAASVTISSSAINNSICAGSNIIFTATPTNGGNAPTYQWKLNGNNITGANSATYSSTSLANNDVITVLMGSSLTSCVTGTPATSNSITTTVTSIPAVPSNINGSSIICMNSNQVYNIPAVAGATSYTWVVTGDLTATPSTTNVINITAANTANGSGTLKVLASNSCGSSVYSNIFTVTISTQPAPTASFTVSGNNVCLTNAGITFTSTSTPNATTNSPIGTYTWTFGDGSTASTAIASNTYTSSGTFDAILTIQDANQCTSSISNRITVDPTSVAGTITAANSTICEGSNTVLTLNGNTGTIQWQQSIDNITFTNINGATSTSYNTGNLTTTTYYRAIVTSGSCSSATSGVVTITVNPTPTATLSSVSNIYTNATSFDLAYSGLIGNPDEYSINAVGPNALPNFNTISNYGLSSSPINVIVPASTIGTYNFNLIVKNGAIGCTSSAIPFTVTVVVLPPASLSYTTPNVYTSGTTITSLNPTSTGGPITQYSISPNLPAGLTINSTTGVISGTPSAVSSQTSYTVTGTNASGTVTATVVITVNTAPPASLSYTTPNVYTSGSTITALNPTSTGGAITSYSINPNLPAGLTIDPTTGIISGTPTTTSSQTTYIVTGTNVSGTVTATVVITVNGSAVAPVVQSQTEYCVQEQVGEYKYVKVVFSNTKNLSSANSIQVAEWKWFNGNTEISRTNVTVTNPNGSNPGGEEPSKIYDGSTNSKWLDFNIKTGNNTSTLLFTYPGTGVRITGYSWVTANDSEERDPKSWIVYMSNDNVNWTQVHTVSNYSAPSSRYTATSAWTFANASTGVTLSATATSGYSLRWYTTSTGGTATTTAPILNTSAPATVTYYVSQINQAGYETPRSTLTVNVNALPAAPVVSGVNYILGATATPLNATALSSHNLQWYSSASGGTASTTAPTPSTASIGTVNYYVSQVNSVTGCEGPRANISVVTSIASPAGLSYTTPNVYTTGSPITALNPTSTGGAIASYSISPSLPAGLTLNTSTGIISGTPTAATAQLSYIVTGTNSSGTVSATVVITVNSNIVPQPQGSLSAVDFGLLASDTVKLKLTTSNGTAPFTIILSNSLNTTLDTITNLTPVNNVIEFLHKKLDTTKVFTIIKLIDANNNVRTSGFTKDTTIVNVLKPQILLTLKADPAVKQADNSFKTRLLLKIKNAGQLDLRNVQINANLSKVFPTGISYVLDSVRVLSGGLVLNPTYSGSGSATAASSFDWLSNASYNSSKSSYAVLDENYLLNNGVNLNKTEEGEIAFYVSIGATTQNVVLKLQFETAGNGVLVKNNGSSSIQQSTSKSDDGTDIIQHPDLTNNGVPLPTYVPLFPNEKIGASLDVSSATPVSGGYQFHFTAKLKNYGNVNLDSLRIQYNFNEIYPSPDQAVLVGTPIVTRGNIVYNLNNFNGYNNLNLFNYGGDLQVGDSATFEYDLKVNTSRNSYTWQNYIVAYGRSVNSGVFVNDTSMAGINPDPNNDNDPLERFFTGATINFVKPLPPTVENKTYIFGQTKPSNIGGLVKSTPSGTLPVWCDTKTSACSINPPSTPTEIGIYVFALRSYDTTTLLYSDVVVYDTVIIKPPVPLVVNKKYIIGAVSNPINIVGQVTGMTGSTLKYFKSATLQSAIPVLGNVPGLTRYTTSQIVNGIESDTVGFTVTMLDPKTMLHLQKIAEEPRLQSNSTFNITYTFLVNNRTDEPMSNVLVVDNLQNTFPQPTVFTKVSLSSTGGLSINNGFNGMNDINLINSTSTLAPSATDTIRLTVNLQPKGFAGTVNNIAVVTATTPYGIINMNSSSQSFANESSKTPTPSIIPDLSIDIPEAFSPNRDGVNDRFIILKPFGTTLDLEVFNRWGNVVYANPNYNNEWDGRGTNNFIGQDLMDGGYYYTLKAKSINGNIQIFKGFVLIQR